MSEEELLKYMTVTDDKVIFDKVFYENTIMNCMDNAIKTKHILTEFEKWLEEQILNKVVNNDINADIKFGLKICLNKLQELKEGKK